MPRRSMKTDVKLLRKWTMLRFSPRCSKQREKMVSVSWSVVQLIRLLMHLARDPRRIVALYVFIKMGKNSLHRIIWGSFEWNALERSTRDWRTGAPSWIPRRVQCDRVWTEVTLEVYTRTECRLVSVWSFVSVSTFRGRWRWASAPSLLLETRTVHAAQSSGGLFISYKKPSATRENIYTVRSIDHRLWCTYRLLESGGEDRVLVIVHQTVHLCRRSIR